MNDNMSKKDEVNDIREKMESIRREKQKREEQIDVGNVETIARVQKLMTPIIKAFIKEDRSLNIQSSDLRSFYIGYGLFRVCRVSIFSSSTDSIRIHLESDTDVVSNVYEGDFNEKAIESSVKDALLKWYTSLF